MTPTEFTALAEAWPSVPALAADLGVSRQAVYLYRKGERSIPGPVARLIRLLHDNPHLRVM